jgi:hypothetical protein
VERGRDRLSAIEDEGLVRPPFFCLAAARESKRERERGREGERERFEGKRVGEPAILGYREEAWPLGLYYWPRNYS